MNAAPTSPALATRQVSRRRRWLLAWGLLTGWLFASSPAAAGPTIVVLAFGGELGGEIREALVAPLSRKFEVLHGDQLLAACDQLGITMSRGKNLATAAAHLGAVAVVGGTVKQGHLVLAVYSGKTGQPLATGSVAFGNSVSRPALGKALVLILKGLRKAPRRVAPVAATPEPVAPLPEPGPRKVRTGAATTGAGGDAASGGGSLTYDPNAPDNPDAGNAAGSGTEENPLEGRPMTAAPVAPPPTVRQRPEGPRPPRILGMLGLGSWMRNFRMNQPVDGTERIPAPQYESAAVTLRLDVRLYPISFFSEDWLAGFVIALQYQQALGLSSQSKQPGAGGAFETKTYGTTMRQLLFGVGYDWKILRSKVLSPHLELTMGFGMVDFAIDWDATATHTMPAAEYRFFLVNLGFRYPFFNWLGAHLGFDYRAVSGSGEIEEDAWYGPSSTGGINLTMGVHGGWKGIIATAEYSYTRYFYAFADAAAREQDPTKGAAGGALDIMHTLMISAGYAF